MSDWGHKYTISVYIEGEATEDTMNTMQVGMDALVEEAGIHGGLEIDFVCASIAVVKDKPEDQVAS